MFIGTIEEIWNDPRVGKYPFLVISEGDLKTAIQYIQNNGGDVSKSHRVYEVFCVADGRALYREYLSDKKAQWDVSPHATGVLVGVSKEGRSLKQARVRLREESSSKSVPSYGPTILSVGGWISVTNRERTTLKAVFPFQYDAVRGHHIKEGNHLVLPDEAIVYYPPYYAPLCIDTQASPVRPTSIDGHPKGYPPQGNTEEGVEPICRRPKDYTSHIPVRRYSIDATDVKTVEVKLGDRTVFTWNNPSFESENK